MRVSGAIGLAERISRKGRGRVRCICGNALRRGDGAADSEPFSVLQLIHSRTAQPALTNPVYSVEANPSASEDET